MLTLRQWDGARQGEDGLPAPFTTAPVPVREVAHSSSEEIHNRDITKREVTKKSSYTAGITALFTDFARKASPFRAGSSQNQISTRRNKGLYRRAAFYCG